jgi:ubiquitin-conjugating enzyme E2 J2
MATVQANRRLLKEAKALKENPPPFIIAKPRESNILEW